MAQRTITVVTVVGARPQFIKAAITSAALARAGIRERLIHTGQHYDAEMSEIFFTELGLPKPSQHFGIGGLPQGAMTGRIVEAVEQLLLADRPDWLMVFGDTNSTLGGALAAAKLHIPIAHVEAGMRCFDRRVPEEINRCITDLVSSLLLVTGETPRRNLERESITKGVYIVGDVMLEAALRFRDAAAGTDICSRLSLSPSSFILATIHRAENTDDVARLGRLMAGLERLAAKLPVVLPLHPRTRQALERVQGTIDLRTIRIVEPLGYLEMLELERHAACIVTDSGGVQREAFFQQVPCVTLRDVTEWPETVELGWNRLVGDQPDELLAAVEAALGKRPSPPPAVYGSGDTGDRIAALLGAELSQG